MGAVTWSSPPQSEPGSQAPPHSCTNQNTCEDPQTSLVKNSRTDAVNLTYKTETNSQHNDVTQSKEAENSEETELEQEYDIVRFSPEPEAVYTGELTNDHQPGKEKAEGTKMDITGAESLVSDPSSEMPIDSTSSGCSSERCQETNTTPKRGKQPAERESSTEPQSSVKEEIQSSRTLKEEENYITSIGFEGEAKVNHEVVKQETRKGIGALAEDMTEELEADSKVEINKILNESLVTGESDVEPRLEGETSHGPMGESHHTNSEGESMQLEEEVQIEGEEGDEEDEEIRARRERKREEMEVFRRSLAEKRTERQKAIASIAEEMRTLRKSSEELESEREERRRLEAHVVALKDVAAISREMLRIREVQVTDLKEKLESLEASSQKDSAELRVEYEKQMENIRSLRQLYDERAAAMSMEHTRQMERERAKVEVLQARLRNQETTLREHDEQVADLRQAAERAQAEEEKKTTELAELKEHAATIASENKKLSSQMAFINNLFSHMLTEPDLDLDKLTSLLKENHNLINDLTTKGDINDTAALLVHITRQSEGSDKSQAETKDDSPAQATRDRDVTQQEIAANLPKVWRVLIELLSHYSAPIAVPDADKTNGCYKDIETPYGTRSVISVSQTFLRLKDLILEKNSLVTEVGRLKTLNTHLETRLENQEKRLSVVSSELHKTWGVVTKMRMQHKQLHTSEQILRYELQHKRLMLNELKEELEYCRVKWEEARKKNDQSEEDWLELRKEFAERKKRQTSNSAESGYDEDDSGQMDASDSPSEEVDEIDLPEDEDSLSSESVSPEPSFISTSPNKEEPNVDKTEGEPTGNSSRESPRRSTGNDITSNDKASHAGASVVAHTEISETSPIASDQNSSAINTTCRLEKSSPEQLAVYESQVSNSAPADPSSHGDNLDCSEDMLEVEPAKTESTGSPDTTMVPTKPNIAKEDVLPADRKLEETKRSGEEDEAFLKKIEPAESNSTSESGKHGASLPEFKEGSGSEISDKNNLEENSGDNLLDDSLLETEDSTKAARSTVDPISSDSEVSQTPVKLFGDSEVSQKQTEGQRACDEFEKEDAKSDLQSSLKGGAELRLGSGSQDTHEIQEETVEENIEHETCQVSEVSEAQEIQLNQPDEQGNSTYGGLSKISEENVSIAEELCQIAEVGTPDGEPQVKTSLTDQNLGDNSEIPEEKRSEEPKSCEEILDARALRLKRLEEQCSSLLHKMTKTSERGDSISNKLDQLHEQYGSTETETETSTRKTEGKIKPQESENVEPKDDFSEESKPQTTQEGEINNCDSGSQNNPQTQDLDCSDANTRSETSNEEVGCEPVLSARAERLKRLEEQCSSLLKKMSRTSKRSDSMSDKLEELHSQYGSAETETSGSEEGRAVSRPRLQRLRRQSAHSTSTSDTILESETSIGKSETQGERDRIDASEVSLCFELQGSTKSDTTSNSDEISQRLEADSQPGQPIKYFGTMEEPAHSEEALTFQEKPKISSIPVSIPDTREFSEAQVILGEVTAGFDGRIRLETGPTKPSTANLESLSDAEILTNPNDLSEDSSSTAPFPSLSPEEAKESTSVPEATTRGDMESLNETFRNTSDRLEDRSMRLKMLENQCQTLFKRVSITSYKREALSNRLEELHEHYGSGENISPLEMVSTYGGNQDGGTTNVEGTAQVEAGISSGSVDAVQGRAINVPVETLQLPNSDCAPPGEVVQFTGGDPSETQSQSHDSHQTLCSPEEVSKSSEKDLSETQTANSDRS